MIKLKNINKSFKVGNEVFNVLQNINLDVREGEKFVIWGKSGSGKSTLLQVISGLLSIDSGTVELDCKTDEIGWVFQNLTVIDKLTSEENILLINNGIRRSQQLQVDLIDYAKILNVDHLLKRYPCEMSFGENQRISIIRGIISKPKILLLDEPTASIDEVNKKQILDFLFNDSYFSGTTMIFVTHDLIFMNYNVKHLQLKDHELTSL